MIKIKLKLLGNLIDIDMILSRILIFNNKDWIKPATLNFMTLKNIKEELLKTNRKLTILDLKILIQ